MMDANTKDAMFAVYEILLVLIHHAKFDDAEREFACDKLEEFRIFIAGGE